MSVSENLQAIILQHKEILEKLEKETANLAGSNLTVENEKLKKELIKSQNELQALSQRTQALTVKNRELKNALYEQTYSEKIKILHHSLQKSDIYFKNSMGGELNQLALIEKDLQLKTNAIIDQLKTNRVENTQFIYKKLNELYQEATLIISQTKEEIAKQNQQFAQEKAALVKAVEQEPLTEEVMEAVGKKNNFETFIGGNLINKLGILFVILGLLAVSRFAFLSLTDLFKGLIMFAISTGLLVGGELLNRKKPNVFSLGLTSGGVAGLYVSLAISYFALNIIPMLGAVSLCIFITLGTFLLSRRYNSQTIACFALIGGYIPIVSIFQNSSLIYSAMVYFVILNLLALLLAFYKKWKVTMFIGYFLNLIGTIVITALMLLRYHDQPFDYNQVITMVYALFSFAIYTLIPVGGNFRSKQKFTLFDICIMTLNTFFSTLLMYIIFYVYDLSSFTGAVSVVFALAYFGLYHFVNRKFADEKKTAMLFYLTGITFVILIIPFQFGKVWLMLGWLVEGLALAIYGILKPQKRFKTTGFAILGLCLLTFFVVDIVGRAEYLFSYKYFALTLGSLLILIALLYKKNMSRFSEKFYKIAVIVNFWLYSLYVIHLLRDYLQTNFDFTPWRASFLFRALEICTTFLLVLILPRMKVLWNKGVYGVSVFLSVVSMLGLFILIGSKTILLEGRILGSQIPVGISILATVILVILSTLSVLTLRSMLGSGTGKNKMSLELKMFFLSAYFLILLSQNLVVQFRVAFTSIGISIIYVVAALGWIIYGFIKRYAFMRRFGLGLTVVAVAKLFLVDLPDLTQGYKIVSYFAFGVTLLGISFVYQYFSKALGVKAKPSVEAIVGENKESGEM